MIICIFAIEKMEAPIQNSLVLSRCTIMLVYFLGGSMKFKDLLDWFHSLALCESLMKKEMVSKIDEPS